MNQNDNSRKSYRQLFDWIQNLLSQPILLNVEDNQTSFYFLNDYFDDCKKYNFTQYTSDYVLKELCDQVHVMRFKEGISEKHATWFTDHSWVFPLEKEFNNSRNTHFQYLHQEFLNNVLDPSKKNTQEQFHDIVRYFELIVYHNYYYAFLHLNIHELMFANEEISQNDFGFNLWNIRYREYIKKHVWIYLSLLYGYTAKYGHDTYKPIMQFPQNYFLEFDITANNKQLSVGMKDSRLAKYNPLKNICRLTHKFNIEGVNQCFKLIQGENINLILKNIFKQMDSNTAYYLQGNTIPSNMAKFKGISLQNDVKPYLEGLDEYTQNAVKIIVPLMDSSIKRIKNQYNKILEENIKQENDEDVKKQVNAYMDRSIEFTKLRLLDVYFYYPVYKFNRIPDEQKYMLQLTIDSILPENNTQIFYEVCKQFISEVLKKTFDGCVKEFGTDYGLKKPAYEFKNSTELNNTFQKFITDHMKDFEQIKKFVICRYYIYKSKQSQQIIVPTQVEDYFNNGGRKMPVINFESEQLKNQTKELKQFLTLCIGVIPHYLIQLERKNAAIKENINGLRPQFLNMYHEDILINHTNNPFMSVQQQFQQLSQYLTFNFLFMNIVPQQALSLREQIFEKFPTSKQKSDAQIQQIQKINYIINRGYTDELLVKIATLAKEVNGQLQFDYVLHTSYITQHKYIQYEKPAMVVGDTTPQKLIKTIQNMEQEISQKPVNQNTGIVQTQQATSPAIQELKELSETILPPDLTKQQKKQLQQKKQQIIENASKIIQPALKQMGAKTDRKNNNHTAQFKAYQTRARTIQSGQGYKSPESVIQLAKDLYNLYNEIINWKP